MSKYSNVDLLHFRNRPRKPVLHLNGLTDECFFLTSQYLILLIDCCQFKDNEILLKVLRRIPLCRPDISNPPPGFCDNKLHNRKHFLKHF